MENMALKAKKKKNPALIRNEINKVMNGKFYKKKEKKEISV